MGEAATLAEGVAGEAVELHSVGPALGVEYVEDVVVGVPVVDDERLAIGLPRAMWAANDTRWRA